MKLLGKKLVRLTVYFSWRLCIITMVIRWLLCCRDLSPDVLWTVHLCLLVIRLVADSCKILSWLGNAAKWYNPSIKCLNIWQLILLYFNYYQCRSIVSAVEHIGQCIWKYVVYLYNKRRYVYLFVCLLPMAGQRAGPIKTKLGTLVDPGSVLVKVMVKVIYLCMRYKEFMPAPPGE